MPASLRRLSAAVLAAALTTAVAAVIVSAQGAEAASTASELRQRASALEERSAAALLELYALEATLERARAELADARARTAEIERERKAAETRADVARRSLTLAHGLLAERLRALYEQDQAEPLEILLGAGSIDEAMAGIDGLTFAAKQDRRLATQLRATRTELAALSERLAARADELRALEHAAAARTAELEAALGGRVATLERLAAEQRLTRAQLSTLERRAQAATVKARSLAPPTATAPDTVTVSEPAAPTTGAEEAPEPRATSGATLTVVATGYAIRGRTATGIPTAPGVVAVDPSVIPLGTRMTIPGYGTGVAADTGGSVRGAKIDVWFPTRAEALRWGVRTVTITLH